MLRLMDISFYKLHIGGNDFFLVNCLNNDLLKDEFLPLLSRNLCRRNRGVGSNGALFIYRGVEHTVRIKFFNSRGSSAVMNHDAFLCAAKYVFDYGLAGKGDIIFESDYGVIPVDCIDSNHFRISIGTPGYADTNSSFTGSETDYSRQELIEGRSIMYTSVTFNETGIAVFYSKRQKNEKKEIADYFRTVSKREKYRTFFVDIYSDDEIFIETYSPNHTKDNSFAAAVAGVSSVLNGLCDREITVFHKNDALYFQWEEKSSKVYITGQPEYVFSGNYYFDEEQ